MSKARDPEHKQTWKLTREARAFLMECLACGMHDQDAADFLCEHYGVRLARSSVQDLRKRDQAKIDARAAEVNSDVELMKLPFVRKTERLAHYGRCARIEIARKRYRDASDQIRRIAEELGALRSVTDVNFKDVTKRSDAELLEEVKGELGRAEPEEVGVI